ncbi:hypothetical protein Thal_0393 [Thermocrinis albus DSM 14484]|uniref:Lysylphosphatidylglycerol synthetase/UPF0104 n=1 Tax=Thermocrinis albus (strain DSM 14484 / JCM 11386 / HI 11/12) TaxID=638303 RepID=D3SPE1_THEAH|nr:lysylphosphatidylglycerol synthase domain-containing protein [Thermocrinis albus]ADC89028.1 hypothetical protein Thal_0393 [Thermocrinis albus DSM 14484]
MRRYIVPTFLFLASALLLHFLIPHETLWHIWQQLSPTSVFYAFLFYTLSQIVRSLRWKILLKELSTVDVFLINSANVFLNNLLPARTGELSWFFYASRAGVNLTASFWTFLVGRLYDFLALLLLLAHYMWFALPILLFLSLFLYKLVFLLPSVGWLKQLREHVSNNMNLSVSFLLLLFSSLSVILKLAAVLVLLGIKPSVPIVLGFVGGELSTVLPIHSLGGLGTYEFAFALPVKLLGESIRPFLAHAFTVHSFLLVSSALLGIPSMVLLHLYNPRRG